MPMHWKETIYDRRNKNSYIPDAEEQPTLDLTDSSVSLL